MALGYQVRCLVHGLGQDVVLLGVHAGFERLHVEGDVVSSEPESFMSFISTAWSGRRQAPRPVRGPAQSGTSASTSTGMASNRIR